MLFGRYYFSREHGVSPQIASEFFDALNDESRRVEDYIPRGPSFKGTRDFGGMPAHEKPFYGAQLFLPLHALGAPSAVPQLAVVVISDHAEGGLFGHGRDEPVLLALAALDDSLELVPGAPKGSDFPARVLQHELTALEHKPEVFENEVADAHVEIGVETGKHRSVQARFVRPVSWVQKRQNRWRAGLDLRSFRALSRHTERPDSSHSSFGFEQRSFGFLDRRLAKPA
mmetsp:Transcript_46097/g.104145  ORF Transcript_46097/g.104145 Transcript_46097/m.104145 type:complete len:228 (+) Transcript_46097:340-1023(+)